VGLLWGSNAKWPWGSERRQTFSSKGMRRVRDGFME
jgi:hypothetical protein